MKPVVKRWMVDNQANTHSLAQGKVDEFFKELGFRYAFFFSFFLLLTLGSSYRQSSLPRKSDLQYFFCFKFLLPYRPQGPPCTVLIFTVPYHGKASCTKCLPIDQRLTRDLLEESILEEVDSLEESSIAAIGICIFETVVVLSLLVASCVKRFEAPRISGVHDTRITPRRNTIFEETISAIR